MTTPPPDEPEPTPAPEPPEPEPAPPVPPAATSGAGTPLVLLHAFPLDGRMWAPQVEALAGTYQVIVPDLRGFGAARDQAVEEAGQVVGQQVHAGLLDGLVRGRPEAAEVGDDHLVGAGQGLDLGGPHAAVEGEGVQQDQRRPGSAGRRRRQRRPRLGRRLRLRLGRRLRLG